MLKQITLKLVTRLSTLLLAILAGSGLSRVASISFFNASAAKERIHLADGRPCDPCGGADPKGRC